MQIPKIPALVMCQPHTRGDGPVSVIWQGLQGAGQPHTRGDGPTTTDASPKGFASAPHTWGWTGRHL